MNEEGDASVVSAQSALLADLEILYHNPININIATREQILRLPFISEAQADSLLLYRQQRRVFRTLGELQVISGIDYTTRCQLSLFTYVGDTIRRKTPLKHIIGHGKHELYNTLHIPLYKREGLVIDPLIHGGKSTTIFRSGTPATPLIASFASLIVIL